MKNLSLLFLIFMIFLFRHQNFKKGLQFSGICAILILNYLKKEGIVLKKLLAVFLLFSFVLTGCETQKEKMDYTEEELPYGATMKSDKKSYAVPMTWDRRFLEEGQIKAVADYLCAIQNADGELYDSVALPLYTQYQITEVYDNYDTTQQLVTGLHEGLVGSMADDFAFDMVLVNGISDDRKKGGLEAIFTILDGISEDGKFSDTVQNAWSLNLEWEFSYNAGKNAGTAEEQYLYLFQIDDKYYCCM